MAGKAKTEQDAPTGSGFDFGAVAQVTEREDEGNTFHVHGETGQPLYYQGQPVTMTVAGTYSKAFQAAEERFGRRKWKGKLSTADWTKARDAAVLAPCVLRWSGFADGGRPVPLEHEYVMRALEVPWLRPQILEAMEDHEGFSGASSAS
jgi:hypothetical protein